MISSLRQWIYYFGDLPLWALGFRDITTQERLAHLWKDEIPGILAGLKKLEQYTGITQANSLEYMAHQSLLVKFARQGDAYSSIGMRQANINKHFIIEGESHLWQAITEQRPIILMTGHFGSFYTIAVALGLLGFPVHPLARTVAHTPDNPWPRRIFEHMNYFQTQRRMRGQYIYTNFAGKLDRQLVTICRQGGTILALPDLPSALFSTGRKKVRLLGFDSSLPSRIVELGLRYNANFLTIWSSIDITESGKLSRRLRIEKPFMTDNVECVLQEYSNRLSSAIIAEPWQWMGLPILNSYIED